MSFGLAARRLVLVAVTFIAALLVPITAEAAQYQESSGPLEVSTSAEGGVAPGTSVPISGSGFAPGSDVTITIESTPRVLATVTADDDGYIYTRVVIPADIEVGAHTIKAAGVTPDGATLVLSTPITVGSSTDPGGGAVGVLGPSGLVIAALGGAMLALRRRRRRARDAF